MMVLLVLMLPPLLLSLLLTIDNHL